MATLHADMMGNPFDPELPVIVTFSNGAPSITLDGGLEFYGPNLWRAHGVRGCRFNARGVPVINEHGEIQRPWRALACNVSPPASFEKYDQREEDEKARKAAIVAKARESYPSIKPSSPAPASNSDFTW